MEKASAAEETRYVVVDQLRSEHSALEARLQELEHHLSHTPDEELEIHRIKKLKLATKDRIALLSRRGDN